MQASSMLRVAGIKRMRPLLISSLCSVSGDCVNALNNIVPLQLPCGNSIVALHDGEQVFPVMLDLISNARQEVLMEMYWFNSDVAGWLVADALIEASNRGVVVRVIYDAFGSVDADESMFESMKEAGVEVIEYNPLSPWRRKFLFARLIRRDHRKLIIIDKKVAVTGGMNIGSEWLPKEDGGQEWRDVMVRIQGPAVRAYSGIFHRIIDPVRAGDDDRGPLVSGFLSWMTEWWQGNQSGKGMISSKILERMKRIPPDTLLLFPYKIVHEQHSNSASDAWWAAQGRLKVRLMKNPSESRNSDDTIVHLQHVPLGKRQLEISEIQSKLQSIGSSIQVITNDAWADRNSIRRGYIRAINAASDTITIVSSYFVPCRSIRTALSRAAARGVLVRVVVPSQNTDMQSVRYASHAMYDYLLKKGIRLFEWKPSVLHAKLCMIDGKVSAIGSYNIDYRSWHYNLEIVTVVHSEDFTRQLEKRIEHDISFGCEEIKLPLWNNRSFLKRIVEQFFFFFRRQM